jgi:hypothetical protein
MNVKLARARGLTPRHMHVRSWIIAGFVICSVFGGCARVRPWQRGRLASPAMQFQMAPFADAQKDSVLEITEGSTFSSAGPGSAGAGCGCH